MSALPIDIWLQLLHERSFCAVPVAGLIAAPSSPRRAAAARRRARAHARTAAASDRARRQTLSLADMLMQRAQDVLQAEDRARAARRAAGGSDAAQDLDDEDTFCDEETCRNTAINALTGAGVEVTEAAIARKMQAHRERERAAVENVRMQRAIDMLLTQLAGSRGSADDDDDGAQE